MAFAYTPGLRVADVTAVRKERRLPLKGRVMVKVGDPVEADTIVARTELPGNVRMINIANILGVPTDDIPGLLWKKEGEAISDTETLAQSKGLFGLFKNTVRSPVSGFFESYNKITGQAVLREPPIPVTIDAYVKGTVVDLLADEGVIVETRATYVQGIFGIGGETRGVVRALVKSPDQELTPELIDPSCAGKILIGGSFVSQQALHKAVSVGVKGVVVGGFDDRDLKEFLGYDLGVAITGHEQKGITLVLTEGFGRMNMAHGTFDLLCSREGYVASINGATQIRAGVIRPEVVIPVGADIRRKVAEHEQGALDIGSPIRVIRAPYFGRLGRVTALPPELQLLETEAKVRVLEVEFGDGLRAVVPRANVELIEE
jgi:hypothetical protein